LSERGQKTIMAVGAHTGDAQLTCGMLLAKHAMAGDKVVIVDLTAGERGAPKGVSIAEFRQQNVDSAKAFAKMLGGESIVMDIPDGELYPGKELELGLGTLMREKQANAVLYHWCNSLHKDHIAAHTITKNAIFFASLPTFEHPLPPAPIGRAMYAENWEDAEGFSPYFYFDVTCAFPLWKEAVKKLWLAEHSTSFKYLRYYEALSIMRGAIIGRDHASCFGTSCFGTRQTMDLI
jgi:LmbE family N-acetylglucosaminyl deacetylase